jgi:haloacetate dehalogenase
MEHFASADIPGETTIYARWHGAGPPVLLLHGFPQTHLMWAEIAARLAERFTVVCADLRGYGRSGCPASDAAHAPYSKRAMARDMVGVMRHLGFDRFAVVGHDRGGRVAYRLALDHPQCVHRLAVLDVVPTSDAWDRADARFALAFWPWLLLAQSEPLPERVLAAAAEAVVDEALNRWGTPATAFAAATRQVYVDMLRDPQRAHAICEEYRAAASIDREHDAADRGRGHRIVCPTLILWSARGPLETWYSAEGGPLGLWSRWCVDVRGRAVAGGHFFPEELPEETAGEVSRFLSLPRLDGRDA